MNHQVVVKFIPADKWWLRAKWELVQEYTSYNRIVTVPEGFITDGASIPLFARLIFSPTGKYFPAAIIHDYIIVSEKNWDKANLEMKLELNALEIARWRRNIILGNVRLWGKYLKMRGMNSKYD